MLATVAKKAIFKIIFNFIIIIVCVCFTCIRVPAEAERMHGPPSSIQV